MRQCTISLLMSRDLTHKFVKYFLAGHSASQWSFCSCGSTNRSHVCIFFSPKKIKNKSLFVCSTHEPRKNKKKIQKYLHSMSKADIIPIFKFDTSCTAETALTHPWSYCFCCLHNCICLRLYYQFLSISFFCLCSGSGLRYQFTCCPSSAGAVNSCLKHSPKLFFIDGGTGAR